MSKTAAERSKEWREKQAQARQQVGSAKDEVVAILRAQIADLKDQRDEADRRLAGVTSAYELVANNIRMLSERVAHVERMLLEQAANLATVSSSGLGGLGGSRSGSPSPLLASEKERDAREFQDLNGETRAGGRLLNGTRVPGRLGDEEHTDGIRMPFAVTPNAVANGTTEQQPNLDSPKTETRARGTLLGPPLLGELSEDEVERRRRAGLNGLAKLRGEQ